jgi:ABC-2 type transport system ATP-binding protein
MLSVKNLTKTFGTQNAVDNISFSAGQGEIIGFLGPNGAGKSTTMKIATGFLPPTSGTVEIAGFDVIEQSLEVRKSVGYLPEHNPLYLDMYVKEYLAWVGGLFKMSDKVLSQAVADNVERTGLGLEQHKKIGALSKGYRQRVGLASAMIHNPKVLILDEPTTGLDPNQIQEIRQVIREAGRERTVVFSSHIMQEVQALCDRVVIINLGKIVADGKLSELQNQSSGRQEVAIEFTTAIDEKLIKALHSVQSVRHLAGGRYDVVAKPKADCRAELFAMASQNQLSLLTLSVKDNSLEKVFQELTLKV